MVESGLREKKGFLLRDGTNGDMSSSIIVSERAFATVAISSLRSSESVIPVGFAAVGIVKSPLIRYFLESRSRALAHMPPLSPSTGMRRTCARRAQSMRLEYVYGSTAIESPGVKRESRATDIAFCAPANTATPSVSVVML